MPTIHNKPEDDLARLRQLYADAVNNKNKFYAMSTDPSNIANAKYYAGRADGLGDAIDILKGVGPHAAR